MSEEQNVHDVLAAKYPEMKPISSPPGLGSLNGIGVGMYGRRGTCVDTGTYVKTQAFCFIFIPILALKAFRVADAPGGGWYFLGRVPLSTFAKGWNGLLAAMVLFFVGSIAMAIHTNSPDYIAKKQLGVAQEHADSGEHMQAAFAYNEVFGKTIARHDEAREGLESALTAVFDGGDKKQQIAALRFFGTLDSRFQKPPIVPDVFERTVALAAQHESADPRWSIQALEEITFLKPDDEALAAKLESLLEAVVKAHPEDVEYVEKLAVKYESQQKFVECFALLEPVAGKLKGGEGARILGQMLVQKGDHARAYDLLNGYVTPKLRSLRSAERTFNNIAESLYQKWFKFLDSGKAQQSFYTKLNTATEEEQGAMIQEYIYAKMDEDRSYLRAMERYREANAIVPVVIDFGIVQLNRARSMQVAAERKAGLEEAEKTFLSIQSAAGDTDDYKLTLGQVYHWLGKEEDADVLFEQLLEKNERSAMILFQLGSTMRDLGAETRARTLLDEAYGKATVDQEKYAIASLRAITSTDTDEGLSWWQKANPSEPHVQTEIASYKGRKALEDGDDEAALRHFRSALKSYDAHPKSASTFNNKALVHLRLFEMTGDPEEHKQGAKLLGEAVRMMPSDSILLYNSATTNIATAVIDEFGGSFNLKKLNRDVGIQLLRFLYEDAPGRSAVLEKFVANENLKIGLAQLDQVMVLAPKSKRAYSTAMVVYGALRDEAQLKSLHERVGEAGLDLSEELESARADFAGADAEDRLKAVKTQVDFYKKLVDDPELKGDALSWAVAATTYGGSLQAYAMAGGEVDTGQVVDLATRAFQKSPNSTTRGGLMSAKLFAAVSELAASDPAVGAGWKKCGTHISAFLFASALLEEGGAPAEALKANRHVQEAIAVAKEQGDRFPDSRSIEDWALLKNTDPERAEVVLGVSNGNEVSRLGELVTLQLAPLSQSSVLSHYWRAKAAGDSAGSERIKADAMEQGFPWPEA